MGTVNDRGRVPFALIGVLLVLTSTTLAVSVGPHTYPDSPDVDDAMDGATAAAVTELRGAVDDAGTDAAIAPVTEPVDTAPGRAINESQPFRDALKLRIYLRAVERLDGVETTRGDVTASASLPTVEATTDGYREAIDRVELERVGDDDAALRVVIGGVTLSATRNGRTVTAVERSPEFVVVNPALLLHDRTETFESRANAPVTRSGFGQRLTARLYPIAWARGYAQYGGAPIATVLGTRHVELAANDALLAEQRTLFGEADPDGHRGVAAAGRRVATTDALVGVGGEEEWQDAVLETADAVGADPPAEQPVGTWRDEPTDPNVTVGVNASSDHAFVDYVGIDGDDRLREAVERVHTVEARVTASATLRGSSRRSESTPGGGWKLVSERTGESVSTSKVGGRPRSDVGWTTRDGGVFDVRVTTTTTRTWKRGNETTTTESVRDRSYRARVTAQARTKPIDGVPAGRLDGHLSDTADRAIDRAISKAGGLDGAARAAARGRTVDSTETATASPVLERSAVESDLRTLRVQTRNISVTVPGPAVGTGRANPPAKLREELESVRDGFFDPDHSGTRARTLRAIRLGYLDALDTELERRSSAFESTGEGIEASLGRYLGPDRLDGALAAHRNPSNSSPELADPAGDLSLAVETGPSYLTTSEVTHDRIDARGGGAVHPLETRSVNVFSSPHGQVASGIFDRIPFLGTERVSLSTAARTLESAHEASPEHERLEAEVKTATASVRGELLDELIDAGVDERKAESALETDASTADQALGLTNGTTIERVVRSIDGPVASDRLELRLRARLDTAMEASAARPREATTTAAQEQARERYGDELEGMLADGIEAGSERARARVLGERLGALPAGLPLAPIPGYWYATANVWVVDVSGQYERFAVRTNRGDGTGATTYLRDGRVAEVKHGDDRLELGSSERVSVRTTIAVVVVVPPGPRGVGDTDGSPIKHSDGWGE